MNDPYGPTELDTIFEEVDRAYEREESVWGGNIVLSLVIMIVLLCALVLVSLAIAIIGLFLPSVADFMTLPLMAVACIIVIGCGLFALWSIGQYLKAKLDHGRHHRATQTICTVKHG